jgi:hypothetical protein
MSPTHWRVKLMVTYDPMDPWQGLSVLARHTHGRTRAFSVVPCKLRRGHTYTHPAIPFMAGGIDWHTRARVLLPKLSAAPERRQWTLHSIPSRHARSAATPTTHGASSRDRLSRAATRRTDRGARPAPVPSRRLVMGPCVAYARPSDLCVSRWGAQAL